MDGPLSKPLTAANAEKILVGFFTTEPARDVRDTDYYRDQTTDGDDPLEGDDGVWGQYLELDETESAQRVPALIVVPYLSPPIDIAPTSPTTRRSSNF